MAQQIDGKKVAVLVANEGIEQVELTEPWKALEGAGAQPELIAPEGGEVQAMNHLDKGDSFPVDRTLGEADPDDYDALMLPGGWPTPTPCGSTPRRSRLPARSSRRAGRSRRSATPPGPWSRRASCEGGR
jgi:protease I